MLDAHPERSLAAGSPGDESLKALLQRVEKDKIASALVQSGGSVTRAARRLGISRQYLHRKLRDHGLRGASDSRNVSD